MIIRVTSKDEDNKISSYHIMKEIAIIVFKMLQFDIILNFLYDLFSFLIKKNKNIFILLT